MMLAGLIATTAAQRFANADESAVGLRPIAGAANVLVFTAPPRETEEEGEAKYAPVAKYMSQVLGRAVVYKHPGTWGIYRSAMLDGSYDIVFDGPHFNSYRAEKLKHNILVKIPARHEFVVIVRHDNTKPAKLEDLAGHTFCTHAPPNLGTLSLLAQFPNPTRQPAIINTKGWDEIYKGVIAGNCEAGILPKANLEKFDRNGVESRVLWKNRALPNQAFSAGPRLTAAEQRRLATALLSPDGQQATTKLRAAYRVGENFELASNAEYAGISEYLRNEWGYY
jgi:ABC-type phosphate/phosphonate transport system substrate-binding protein